jgi:Sushi repeat (SCR repeat)
MLFSAVFCENISLPLNAQRNSSDNAYMAYVEYTCNGSKHMLDGSSRKVIVCDANGLWSDQVTDCQGLIFH